MYLSISEIELRKPNMFTYKIWMPTYVTSASVFYIEAWATSDLSKLFCRQWNFLQAGLLGKTPFYIAKQAC